MSAVPLFLLLCFGQAFHLHFHWSWWLFAWLIAMFDVNKVRVEMEDK